MIKKILLILYLIFVIKLKNSFFLLTLRSLNDVFTLVMSRIWISNLNFRLPLLMAMSVICQKRLLLTQIDFI